GAGDTPSLAIASSDDKIFVGGQFTNTTNLGATRLTAAGTQDAFVAAYHAIDGSPVWDQQFGGANASSYAPSIAVAANHLTVAVSFSLAPIIVGTQTLTPASGDIAITKLDPSTGMPVVTPSQFSIFHAKPIRCL
ncbi:MAG TPA: hypothetical protein VGC42_23330, partial [Kofleriaceae bacterium]